MNRKVRALALILVVVMILALVATMLAPFV